MDISVYLPPDVLTNETLAAEYNSPNWTASKIFRKTGIHTRHIVKEELVSDLAVNAAEKLFSEYSIERSTIDFLLLCTQSPDYYLPSTSCIIQERLKLRTGTGAFDYNLGCSGFVYGLAVAKGLLSAGIARRVLLITAETYTRHIHHQDRSTRTIFGDAAAATLITTEDIGKIKDFVLGTDGSGANNLIVPAGAMALPRNPQTSEEKQDDSGNIRSKNNIYMNGPEIFAFTLRTVPKLVEDTLYKNGLTKDDIDYYIFHQANRYILTVLREKLDIPEEKFYIDVESLGNTVSSTIPIALHGAIKSTKIKTGSKVFIAGFGVGYSWGAAILQI